MWKKLESDDGYTYWYSLGGYLNPVINIQYKLKDKDLSFSFKNKNKELTISLDRGTKRGALLKKLKKSTKDFKLLNGIIIDEFQLDSSINLSNYEAEYLITTAPFPRGDDDKRPKEKELGIPILCYSYQKTWEKKYNTWFNAMYAVFEDLGSLRKILLPIKEEDLYTISNKKKQLNLNSFL